jgi:hypothetical protein
VNIIGLGYEAEVGKDTAADLLVAEFGFLKVSLADPMKRICREVFGFTDEQLWGLSEKRNEPDKRFFMAKVDGVPVYLTPRKALQLLGTEWGRACYEDVWVDHAIRTAERTLKFEVFNDGVWGVPRYDLRTGFCWDCVSPDYAKTQKLPAGVVIPDVRYPNEARGIKAAGGQVWHIDRPSIRRTHDAWRSHSSENSLRGYPFDATIANHWTLEQFKTNIRTMMAVSGMLDEAGL